MQLDWLVYKSGPFGVCNPIGLSLVQAPQRTYFRTYSTPRPLGSSLSLYESITLTVTKQTLEQRAPMKG